MNTSFDFLSGISFSPKGVAGFLFFAISALVAVISVILFFHWRKYGLGGPKLAFMEVLYLAVSAALLIVAFLSSSAI